MNKISQDYRLKSFTFQKSAGVVMIIMMMLTDAETMQTWGENEYIKSFESKHRRKSKPKVSQKPSRLYFFILYQKKVLKLWDILYRQLFTYFNDARNFNTYGLPISKNIPRDNNVNKLYKIENFCLF